MGLNLKEALASEKAKENGGAWMDMQGDFANLPEFDTMGTDTIPTICLCMKNK